MLSTVHGQVIENPYDSNGWSILNVANTTKILYVSNAGDDDTGVVYSNTAGEIGSDPILPVGPINPFLTIAAAASQVSNGEAVWILLKRGDVFFESLVSKSGNSFVRPMVYASYGSGNQPPLLKTGPAAGINGCCHDTKHLWLIGLSFYAHTRNPDDTADYINADGTSGFNFYTGDNYTIDNILIEGCTFSFYQGNVIQGSGFLKNIRLRRNVLRNNYSTISHSQGLYTNNITGGILLDENIFDHNGWHIQSYSTNGKENGQATIFNHHTYFSHVQDVTFRGNAFHRPSSIGNKWTATEPGSTADITIENNFYNDCEVAISMGGNDETASHRFKNISFSDNVITSSGLSQPTNRTLAWNISINDWDNGVVNKNLIIHQTHPPINNGEGISFKGENRDLMVSENIFYNLENTVAFRMNNLNGNTNVSITNNELTQELLGSGLMVHMVDADYTSLMSNNAYALQENSANNFNITGTNYSLDDWIGGVGEVGATNTVTSVYSDPNRSFDRYVVEVLDLEDRNEYYQKLDRMNYLNWNVEYTATAINDWIRSGFLGTISSNDNQVNSSLIKMFPNPGTGMIRIKSPTEGNYQIYNVEGKIILFGKLYWFSEIDLTNELTGLYVIKFYDQSSNLIETIKYLKR
jgi:hypothetical protein